MFDSINIASTGLSSQRLRLDVISNNIANITTSRSSEGGPYRRSYVVLKSKSNFLNFKSYFLPKELEKGVGEGVEVVSIKKSNKPFRLKYDPSHPDALVSGSKAGYVQLPNTDLVEEMVNMISAARSYEANLSVIRNSKQIFMKTLEIGT